MAQRLSGRRREGSDTARVVGLLQTAHVLHLVRLGGLSGPYLKRNQAASAALACELRRLQGGATRLSHYCSRRTGADVGLLGVEFFARDLASPRFLGSADYDCALYSTCRRADMRFRLLPGKASLRRS